MTHRLVWGFVAVLAVLTLCLLTETAAAQQTAGTQQTARTQQTADQSKISDKIVEVFHTNIKKWEGALKRIAASLFWLLVTIELAWGAGRLILRNADLSEWLSELTSQIVFIGFFWALLNHSSEWAGFVVQSFQRAADQAAQADGVQSGARPSDVLDAGLAAASQIATATSGWRPMEAVGLLIGAFVVIICFALMAAFMAVVLVETYLVISAGVLFMGFGGSRWTKDYALAQASYTVSVGAKLFIIQLIATLSQQVFKDLAVDYGASAGVEQVLLVIGASVIFFVLMWIIPSLVQGVLQGQSLSSPESTILAVRELRAASRALHAAAKYLSRATIGGGKAVASAGKLASRQLEDPKLNTGQTGDGWLVRTGRNLAGAAARHVGARLGGWIDQSAGAQMAADMNARPPEGDWIDEKLGRTGSAKSGQTKSQQTKSQQTATDNTIHGAGGGETGGKQ